MYKLYEFAIKRVQLSKAVNMSTKCEIAVCQFTATNNKIENIEIVKRLVAQAAEQSAKVVFLPEATDYLAISTSEAKSLCEPLSGPLMNEYRNLAKLYKIWLSVGFHEKKDVDTIYNSHVVIDGNGEIRSIYRKIHLFDVSIPEKNIDLRESDLNKGGSQILSPIRTPAGNLALAICYDLRFPELSTLQTMLGADILTYPSAFTHHTGAAHWEILLRARSIENQCYVVAAAQYGKHNDKRISYGHSMIVDPWGKIIAECPKYSESMDTNESVAIGTVDLDYVKTIRLSMPLYQHRRSDIYRLNLIENKIDFKDEDTFKFSDKEIPGATVILRTQHCYAFTNIRCVVPGHVLVSTIKVAPRLQNLTQEEIADLFHTAVKISKALEKEYNTSSSTFCVQDGIFAGQTVPHVHVHILPRRQGDFENNDDIYMHLANHDKGQNPDPFRSKEEMINEAARLRQYFE